MWSKLFLGAALVVGANADLYLHNPPGSNDRNRERNENRNNGNRLFDSQNNNKGGYPWRGDREVTGVPDPSTYYEGSKLLMEWTVQHACGDNPTTHCDFIVQYACEDTLPGLRDGYPTGALVNADGNNGDYDPPYQRRQFNDNNNDGTNRIDQNTNNNVEYGRHESFEQYTTYCTNMARNKGLFLADRKLNNNDARSTRQNPNGNRNGFECPEERDYYPYWNPTLWKDLAVLTSDAGWCDYFQEHSQNVEDKWMCQGANNGNGDQPINSQECLTAGGQWVNMGNNGMSAPQCTLHAASRQNHLGNADPVPNMDDSYSTKDVGGGTAASWELNVPDVPDGEGDDTLCVLRVRYNISTADYNSVGAYNNEASFTDSTKNCPSVNSGDKGANGDVDTETAGPATESCENTLANGNRPLYNRPYVQAFQNTEAKLSIALNTDQSGRTFQDRTHVFKISKRPSGASGTIWNMNMRGRRGNIVQAYPAVEYGFFPAELTASQGDLIHFQFHGSDFNQARNPNNAEGWQYSDRTNLVQMEDANHQFPLDWDTYDGETFFKTYEQALEFALLDSRENLLEKNSNCGVFKAGEDNENNDPTNCGKLNYASATWQPTEDTADGNDGLVKVDHTRKKYSFISTRNNNFSNRSQKLILRVTGLQEWEKALIGTSVAIAVIAPIAAFLFWVMYVKGMGAQEGFLTYCCCCLGSADSLRRKDMKKRRKKNKKRTEKALAMEDVQVDSNQA